MTRRSRSSRPRNWRRRVKRNARQATRRMIGTILTGGKRLVRKRRQLPEKSGIMRSDRASIVSSKRKRMVTIPISEANLSTIAVKSSRTKDSHKTSAKVRRRSTSVLVRETMTTNTIKSLVVIIKRDRIEEAEVVVDVEAIVTTSKETRQTTMTTTLAKSPI